MGGNGGAERTKGRHPGTFFSCLSHKEDKEKERSEIAIGSENFGFNPAAAAAP